MPPHNSTLTKRDKDALSELKDQIKTLALFLNFPELSKDGSNFLYWCDETARASIMTKGMSDFWDSPFPYFENQLGCERNRGVIIVVDWTINNLQRKLLKACDKAEAIMQSIKSHFRKGGRTTQFSLFHKLITIRTAPHEEDILNHTLKIDVIIADLKASGFQLNQKSVTGLVYHLNLPTKITKAVNKELDSQFEGKNGLYTL